MYFEIGGSITRTMTENFREINITCNNIFISIFIAKVIIDFREIFP